jgi:hypothetical protein
MQLGIPYAYQQANCHNISHYIRVFLESKGVRCAKIWVFAPIVYAMNSNQLISFIDKKNLSTTGTIDWGYHVAPVVQVKIGKKVRKMVIDPGLFPKNMVRYRTWLAKLRTRKLIYLIMDSEWYLYSSSTIPNSQIQFNNNNWSNINQPNLKLPDWFSDKLVTDFFKYEDEAQNEYWMEKGLAVNQTAIEFYISEIKPILHTKQQTELLYDYKILVGNVFNFETIFRDNNWNYEMDANFQYKHHSIIAKYQEIYEANLAIWKESVAVLQQKIILKTKKSIK